MAGKEDNKCCRQPDGKGIALAPTGKKFTMTGVNFWHIVDGKVVEKEGIYDQLGFFKQLGVIEYTGKGKKLFPEDVT